MKWKPIYFAPYDGTHVLVANYNDPPVWVTEAYYKKDHGWYPANVSWTDNYASELFPSYWMPLPKPPKKSPKKKPTQNQINIADRLAVKIVTLVVNRLSPQGKLYAYEGVEAAREIRRLILKEMT